MKRLAVITLAVAALAGCGDSDSGHPCDDQIKIIEDNYAAGEIAKEVAWQQIGIIVTTKLCGEYPSLQGNP